MRVKSIPIKFLEDSGYQPDTKTSEETEKVEDGCVMDSVESISQTTTSHPVRSIRAVITRTTPLDLATALSRQPSSAPILNEQKTERNGTKKALFYCHLCRKRVPNASHQLPLPFERRKTFLAHLNCSDELKEYFNSLSGRLRFCAKHVPEFDSIPPYVSRRASEPNIIPAIPQLPMNGNTSMGHNYMNSSNLYSGFRPSAISKFATKKKPTSIDNLLLDIALASGNFLPGRAVDFVQTALRKINKDQKPDHYNSYQNATESNTPMNRRNNE